MARLLCGLQQENWYIRAMYKRMEAFESLLRHGIEDFRKDIVNPCGIIAQYPSSRGRVFSEALIMAQDCADIMENYVCFMLGVWGEYGAYDIPHTVASKWKQCENKYRRRVQQIGLICDLKWMSLSLESRIDIANKLERLKRTGQHHEYWNQWCDDPDIQSIGIEALLEYKNVELVNRRTICKALEIVLQDKRYSRIRYDREENEYHCRFNTGVLDFDIEFDISRGELSYRILRPRHIDLALPRRRIDFNVCAVPDSLSQLWCGSNYIDHVDYLTSNNIERQIAVVGKAIEHWAELMNPYIETCIGLASAFNKKVNNTGLSMSEFSESYHIRTKDSIDVITILDDLKLSGFVFPETNGWVTFVVDESEFAPIPELIKKNTFVLFHYIYIGDYGWSFSLYNGSAKLVSYTCSWNDGRLEFEDSDFSIEALISVLDYLTKEDIDSIQMLLKSSDQTPVYGAPPAYRVANAIGLECFQWISSQYVEDAVLEEDESVSSVIRVGYEPGT